jgi:hypothetical protein
MIASAALDLPMPCSLCGELAEHLTRSGRCERCTRAQQRTSERARGATVHPTLPFEKDIDARAWVICHPEGGTLEEVGSALGVTRERIRQLESLALGKLRRACLREGIDAQELLAGLRARDELAPHPDAGEDRLVRVVDLTHPADEEGAPSHEIACEPWSLDGLRFADAIAQYARAADRLAALLGIEVDEEGDMANRHNPMRLTHPDSGIEDTIDGWAERLGVSRGAIDMRRRKKPGDLRYILSPRIDDPKTSSTSMVAPEAGAGRKTPRTRLAKAPAKRAATKPSTDPRKPARAAVVPSAAVPAVAEDSLLALLHAAGWAQARELPRVPAGRLVLVPDGRG